MPRIFTYDQILSGDPGILKRGTQTSEYFSRTPDACFLFFAKKGAAAPPTPHLDPPLIITNKGRVQ